jgi:hypothetical protein
MTIKGGLKVLSDGKEVYEPTGFSRDVIIRVMGDDRYLKFLEEYSAAKLKRGQGFFKGMRRATLESAISPEDMRILRSYLEDTDYSIKELSEQQGIDGTKFSYRASKAALSLLYQRGMGLLR